MKSQFIQNLILIKNRFTILSPIIMLTNILAMASRTKFNQSVATGLKYQYFQSQLKDTNPKLFQVLTNIQKTLYLQKAYLAGRIIQLIKKPSQPIIQKSLKDQILDFIDSDDFASNSSKTQVSKIFTEGVKLPFKIYRQIRVIQAQNIDSSKVIFHPTRLVTGRAFDFLENNQKAYLFTGHYGISKTISTIFYQKLSDFVIDYKFRTKNPFQQIELFQKVPKLLYWSIDLQKDTAIILKELFNLQFLDIQKKLFNQLNDMQKKLSLANIYQKINIQIVLVVDQLQNLISEVRSQGYTSTKQNRKKRKFRRIIQIDNIIKNCHDQMTRIVFLTSNNSQLYLKNQLSLIPQKTHSPILYQNRITLHKQLKMKQNKIQLIDFFLNCLNQSLLSNVKKLIENQGKKIYQLDIKSFCNEMRVLILSQFDNEPIFYINHYTIRTFLNNMNYLKKQQIQQKMCISFQSLKNQTVNLFKQAYSEMLKQLNKKVAQFLDNDSPHKTIKNLFMVELYNKFMQNKELGLPDSTLVKIESLKLKFNKIGSIQHLVDILDRHIFEIDQQKNITCIVPPTIFFNLQTKNQTQTYLSYAAKQLLEIKTQNLIKYLPKGSAIGLTLQKICKILLTKGSSQVRIFNNSGTQLKNFQDIFAEANTFKGIPSVQSGHSNRSFKIHQQYSFLQSLKKGLLDMISTTQKHQAKQINRIFFPIKRQFQHISTISNEGYEQYQEMTNSISKDFDLILVNYQKNINKFNIYALDITIDHKIIQIKNKMEKFLQSYKLFLDKQKNKIQIDGNQYEVSLNYYVASIIENDQMTKMALQSALVDSKLLNYFIDGKDSNQTLKVKANNEEKLLNQIGFLCLNQNLKILNDDITITETCLFKNIVNFVKGSQKKLQKKPNRRLKEKIYKE